jgi:hypothetical protein
LELNRSANNDSGVQEARSKADRSLLFLGILFAVVAQALIFNGSLLYGLLLYLAGASGLWLWVYMNPEWRELFTRQVLQPRWEALLFGLLVFATAVSRFYDLRYRVYALGSDESIWTSQAWYSVLLRADWGEFAAKHYLYQPVDFWMRSIFMRLFGINYFSARIESAVFSILAVVFLFLLIRALTSSPALALLCALLYSFSYVELNASHQAHHSSPPSLWMMSALFLLITGLQTRNLWRFQVCGVLMALGMLTYDTFLPTVALVVICLVGISAYEIITKRNPVDYWPTKLFAALWPAALVYILFTHAYLGNRYGGWNSDQLQGLAHVPFMTAFGQILKNAVAVLTATFSMVSSDQVVEWPGPFINPLLLPFVVIGFTYALLNIRRPAFAFILIWYLVQTLPGPVILGAGWPRVMYTSLAPLMVFGALGLYFAHAALRTQLSSAPRRVAALSVLALALILANDYHIFTSLWQRLEDMKRRELADLSAESAAKTPFILYPYLLHGMDSVELESNVILFSVGGARRIGLEAEGNFRQVEYENLMSALWEARSRAGLDVIYDKAPYSRQEVRAGFLNVALVCYPGAQRMSEGRYFDVYHFPISTLTDPDCYSFPAPAPLSPPAAAAIPRGRRVSLAWDSHDAVYSSHSIQLEKHNEGVNWLEIEEHFAGAIWLFDADLASGYNGFGFLYDQSQAEPATARIEVAANGRYRLWIRYYKREENGQQNLLSLAGQTLHFAENGGPLNEWVWQDLGVFDLQSGEFKAAISRTYPPDEHYSVFMDTLVITSDLNSPPEGQAIWQPVIDTGEVTTGESRYVIPGELLPGEYRWSVRFFDGARLVDPTGQRGVESVKSTFTILP